MFEGWSATDTSMDVKPRRLITLDPAHATILAAVVRTRDRRLLLEYGGVEGIIRALDTDCLNGIPGDADDINARRRIFGSNFGRSPGRAGLVKGFQLCARKAIKDPAIIILVSMTFVSLCFGIRNHGTKPVWWDTGPELVQVIAMVIAWAMMKYWPVTLSPCDFSAPDYLEYDARVDVVRKCEWMKIPISRVVVGDVVFLKPGDQAPADGLFVDGHSFILENVINSIGNGNGNGNGNGKTETAEVGRENPFIFSGNIVAGGYSRMVVTAVGRSCKNHPPKQMIWMNARHARELQNLTATVGRFGKAFALSTFMWFLFCFCVEETEAEIGGDGEKEVDIVEKLIALVGMFATYAIIASTYSLEGVLTERALAFSLRSLLNDQVLIKKPALCHQVASVDTICFNKTGTLTSDFTEVKKFWVGSSSIEQVSRKLIASNVLELLHQAIGLNIAQPRLSSTFSSSLTSTEEGISKWAKSQLGMETESLRRSCTILEIEPFNPSNRKSGVLISKSNAIHVHRKGAVDSILPMCSHYYETGGTASPINNTSRALFEQIVKGMEENGLRCIAFAHRKTSIEEYFNFSRKTPGLTLLGLVGLRNPMRSGVRRAVEDCQRAGIDFKLLTGDSTLTAEFMALRGGLLDPDIKQGQVVEGEEFRNYTREERMRKVDQIRVLTRATTLDKQLLVQCLRKNGRVVAYVGGGQSDVRALEEANVGICFGTESGAEALKTCSDIVVKEKKFLLLIEILKWGRGFYDSIRAYTQFFLTATFVDLMVCFVMTISPSGLSIFFAITSTVPIPVFHLVYVKLILGVVTALCVLTKQPTDDLMSMPPRDPNEPLMTDNMYRNINAQAMYQIIALLAIHFKGKSLLKLNPSEKNTVIFNTYVLCQAFNLIIANRHGKKSKFAEIHTKKWLWCIIWIIVVLQVMGIAGTTRLDARQWGLCIFVAASSTPISWLLRYMCPMNIPHLIISAKGFDLKS